MAQSKLNFDICKCFELAGNQEFKYTLCNVIRDNTHIKVYKIQDNQGKYYVLKIIPEGPDMDIILREFNILMKLDHKNILKVYDYHILATCNNGICRLPIRFCYGEKYQNCIAMRFEYCDGLDLSIKIKESNLTKDDKLYIAKTITSTLAFLHLRDIIHRDIKPGNIFFKNGEPVLGDFGESKCCEIEADLTQKQTNEYVGTEIYIAPEVKQRNGEEKREYSSRADSYSWGITLAELFYSKSLANGKFMF